MGGFEYYYADYYLAFLAVLSFYWLKKQGGNKTFFLVFAHEIGLAFLYSDSSLLQPVLLPAVTALSLFYVDIEKGLVLTRPGVYPINIFVKELPSY